MAGKGRIKMNNPAYKPFWLMSASFVLLGAVLVVLFPKGDLVLWLNQHHQPFTDTFFKYWTNLGDGLMYAVLGVSFLLFRFYYFFLTLILAIIQTIPVQLMKRWLFNHMPRPKAYFGEDVLHFIPGVDVHMHHAFPSGHTATAFAIATLLILLIKKPVWSTVLFLGAVLVAVSRMVILQHFLMDVYVGAIIGMLSAIGVYYYFNYRDTRLSHTLWSQHGLLYFFRKKV